MRHIKDEPYLFASEQVATVAHEGVDITARCFAFDVAPGFAYCFKMKDGAIELDSSGAKNTETLLGRISFTIGSGEWHRGPANISGHTGERKPIQTVSLKKS